MNKIERLIVFPLLGVLFIVFAFTDWQISTSMYFPDSVLAIGGELFAETPLFILMVFASSLLFRYRPKKSMVQNVLYGILFWVLIVGFSLYAANALRGYINSIYEDSIHIAIYWDLLIAIPYLAIGHGLSYLVKNANPKTAFSVGLAIIIIFAMATVFAYILKFAWFRPRYRTLVKLEKEGLISSVAEYWHHIWQPQGVWSYSSYSDILSASAHEWGMDDFFSFPSGHTMEAVSLLGLALLPLLSNKENPNPRTPLILRCVVYAYGVLIAICRILMGAHTGTDVVMGFAISAAAYDLTSTVILPKLLTFKQKEAVAS